MVFERHHRIVSCLLMGNTGMVSIQYQNQVKVPGILLQVGVADLDPSMMELIEHRLHNYGKSPCY